LGSDAPARRATWRAARGRRALGLALVLAAAAAVPARAVQVYHTDAEALALAFPDATRIEQRAVTLDEAALARVSRHAGYAVRDRTVLLREAYRGDALVGRALVLEELGKTLPFRFLVAIAPDGKVDQVLLLAYREPRGYEIERDAFRDQYRGKALGDPVRRGEDVRNVTGATISVDSLSRGVRRALALCAEATSAPAARSGG